MIGAPVDHNRADSTGRSFVPQDDGGDEMARLPTTVVPDRLRIAQPIIKRRYSFLPRRTRI
jgi:hypothetical protein